MSDITLQSITNDLQGFIEAKARDILKDELKDAYDLREILEEFFEKGE